jgi:hypothetical protein
MPHSLTSAAFPYGSGGTPHPSRTNWLGIALHLCSARPTIRGCRPAFAENSPRVNGDKEPSERTSTISRQTVVLNPRKIKHLQEDQQLKEEQKMNITYHEENGYLIPIKAGLTFIRIICPYWNSLKGQA